jgi:ubiquinone/menaquinone biosynthesis C-methylase UbiE
LLEPANLPEGGAWADLGAGSGAFTLALRELVGPEAKIYAVDKDHIILRVLERAYARLFADVSGLRTIAGDFSVALDLPVPLDGILMANSLHFFRDKQGILQHVRTFLKPDGLLMLVEYNVDRGNPWVPFPLSFKTFQQLAIGAGFGEPRLVASHPSSFLREFYSAAANVL